MKKSIVYLVAFALMLAASSRAAMDVATARALGDGAGVEVGPVYVSTTNDLSGSWYAISAQDDSGGVQLAGPGTVIPDFIAANNIVPGSCVTISGTNDTFYGTYQLTYVGVATDYGVSNVPAALPIDIDTLATLAPALTNLEGKLVAISGVDFEESGTFAGGTTYTIWKNGTNGDVRVQDYNDPLVGTAIPYGDEITITGIFGRYNTSYQILPLVITGPTRDPYLWREPYPDLNFGIVYPNYSRTMQITIKNGGDVSNLTITGFASTSGDTDKFLPANIPDFTLPPRVSTNFSFVYTPGIAGGVAHIATYQFNSNDPSNQTVQFQLLGTASSVSPPAPAVWINEAAYDDPSVDDEEFIELCGEAGTDITGWKIELLSGSDGSNYASFVIGTDIGTFTFADEENGFGFYVLAGSSSPDVPNKDETIPSTIQNGDDDAIRLTRGDSSQVHFFAYESKSAMDYVYGLPNDITPLADSSATSNSLSLVGTGVQQPDFIWEVTTHTPGVLNTNQTLLPEPVSICLMIASLAAALALRK